MRRSSRQHYRLLRRPLARPAVIVTNEGSATSTFAESFLVQRRGRPVEVVAPNVDGAAGFSN